MNRLRTTKLVGVGQAIIGLAFQRVKAGYKRSSVPIQVVQSSNASVDSRCLVIRSRLTREFCNLWPTETVGAGNETTWIATLPTCGERNPTVKERS